MASADHPEAAVDIVAGELAARAGFRVTEASEFAGGPIELEFFTEIPSGGPRYLFVPGDRMRHRPGQFSFAATFAGVSLADPRENVPDMGGPATVVEIAFGHPWRQPLILNQFLRLEAVLDLLKPGESGQLIVNCRRPLALAADQRAALMAGNEASIVQVPLTLAVRRDDSGFAALVDRLVDEVRHGAIEQRTQRLELLLSLRAPGAIDRRRALANHPDAAVAARVRQSLLQHER